jgi:hypothetical protein
MEVANHEVGGVQINIDGRLRQEKAATPPLTNMDTKPRAKRDAEVICMFAPYRLPSQIRVMIVAGMVIVSVGKENKSEEKGFIPLTNM